MADSSSITLQLIDPDGSPLAGALVGLHLGRHLHTGMQQWLSSHVKRDRGPAKSDETGRVSFTTEDLFPPSDPNAKTAVVYAEHRYRELAGLLLINRAQIGREIRFPVKRGCVLHGQVTSTELRQRGHADYWWSNVILDWNGHRPLSFATSTSTFDFLVPPGQYTLHAYGRDTVNEKKKIRIGNEQRDADVRFDLPMTELAKKFGQPAPELTPMKVWRYGGPVKLADLRGSIVLLTFWGSTDADQGRQLIPTLQDLHEEYHDHGLRIVALHDATIKNEARFDEKLNILLRKDWENRQPEFPIALDVGGLKRGRSLFDWHVVGNNAHAYGVHHPPVSILIDREGKLLREIHPQVPLMQFELGRMLGVEAMLAVEPA